MFSIDVSWIILLFHFTNIVACKFGERDALTAQVLTESGKIVDKPFESK
jgi:IS1 family transposase